MPHSDFVHLHLHTQYSLLDGAIRIEPLLQRAEALQMPALAVTDHGNLFGAIKFYRAAKAHGIKPILGCEVYMAQGSRFDRTPLSGDSAVGVNHLLLLVKDETGYQNLIRIVGKSHLESFYYRPRVDRELLEHHAEGLIATSACLNGEIPQRLLQGDEEGARQTARYYRDLFPDRFYIEVQDHGISEQKKVVPGLIKIARELELPLLASNDCHYLEAGDASAHETLLCIQTGKTRSDPARWKFGSDQLYLKSSEEMRALCEEFPEAWKNTLRVAERCNLDIRFGEGHLPHYETPDGTSLDEYLARRAQKGLEARLSTAGPAPGLPPESYPKRLDEELRMIREMHYSGYFLIVSDFIDYAKGKDIPVGPGRGSSAGSLVAYSLGVTDLDPLRYGLLFERFLNPERVSMPDIDIDFCMERREEVIQYVTEKYGRENVAQIITFGTMMAKGVIRDVGRAMDVPYGEVDRIAKLVPTRLNITLEEALQEEPRLREQRDREPRIAELLQTAKTLEGLSRHSSTHAAGVVISPRPLIETVPLAKGTKGEALTQYDMLDIEALGLLKMDFLGLRTLTVIRRAEELIRTHGGQADFQIENIPLDDSETFRLFGEARTTGVFQCESQGVREILKRLRPERFEDIIAVVALYRPGPLGSGMVEEFINRRHGKVPTEYDLPQLEDILKETHGVILYQEQVMQMATLVAGFSPGAADLLRRAMGKKKPEEMARQRENFLRGCAERKVPTERAERLFELMAYFAGYGFNKSHSAAYALVAYRTAYLKAHYPREFMASLLTCDMDNTDKVMKNIGECREMNIPVLPPDINQSGKQFTVATEGIRFGLAAVKNVGEGAVDEMIKARTGNPFSSLFNFCERVDSRQVNRRVVESLVKCGAFDSTGAKRSQLMAVLDQALGRAGKSQQDRMTGQKNLFGADTSEGAVDLPLPSIEEWPERELLSQEREALGFFITGHPLDRFERDLKLLTDTNTGTLPDVPSDRKVRLGGIVSGLKVQTTKKGDLMVRFRLEDLEGFADVIAFPDTYKKAASHLEMGDEPILVIGTTDSGDNGVTLKAEKILPLTQARKKMASRVFIRVPAQDRNREVLRALLIDLKEALGDFRGDLPLVLQFLSGTTSREKVFDEFKVDPSPEMVERVEAILGKNAVHLR